MKELLVLVFTLGLSLTAQAGGGGFCYDDEPCGRPPGFEPPVQHQPVAPPQHQPQYHPPQPQHQPQPQYRPPQVEHYPQHNPQPQRRHHYNNEPGPQDYPIACFWFTGPGPYGTQWWGGGRSFAEADANAYSWCVTYSGQPYQCRRQVIDRRGNNCIRNSRY